MTRKKVFIRSLTLSAAVTLMLCLAGTIYAQKVWSLKDCIDYALENNIQIKQSEITSETNKAALLGRKLDLLPSLNGSASHSYGWGRSIDLATYEYTNKQTQQDYFSVNSNLTIFSGLQKFNAIKRDQYNYLASKYDSDKMRDDISLAIAAAYLQILYSQELVKQALEQVEVTNQQIDRTMKMVDAGTLPKGDLLDIQSQGASEELNLINARNQVRLANLDLLQILDMSVSEQFDIITPDIRISENPEFLASEKIFKFALTHLPEIKSAEYNLLSAQSELSRARGLRSPTISVRGSWGTNYSDQIINTNPNDPDYLQKISFKDQFKDNQNTTLSLSLNIPIFNSFQVSTYINQSKLNSMYSEYSLELQKNQVRKNIEQAYTDALAAFEAYQATLKSLIAFEEAFKYMEQKFNVGIVNSLDYNMAKTQLSVAESNLLSAKYDYIFKTKILDFYMGRPIVLTDTN